MFALTNSVSAQNAPSAANAPRNENAPQNVTGPQTTAAPADSAPDRPEWFRPYTGEGEPAQAGAEAVQAPRPARPGPATSPADALRQTASRSPTLPPLPQRRPNESAQAVAEPPSALIRVAAPQAQTVDEIAAIAPAAQLAAPPKISPEVDQLGGRLVVLGFAGTQPSQNGPKAIRALIASGAIAGVVIRRENVTNGDALAELVRSFRRADRSGRLLVIAQEIGGRNSYLTFARNALAWPSQREIGQRNNPVSAHLVYQHLGANLSAVGINVNLGPVLKLSDNARDTDSFGNDLHHAAAFAKAFIVGHRDSGVLAVPVIDAARPEQVQVLETLLANSRTLPVAAHPEKGTQGGLRFPPNLAGETARFCILGDASDENVPPAAADAVRLGCDFLIADGKAAPDAARLRIVAAVEQALRDGALPAEQFAEATERAGLLASSVAGETVRVREAFR